MKPCLLNGTMICHGTLVSVSPGKGSVLPGAEEHQLRYHMLSMSTDLPKNISLPTLTGTGQCSPGRHFTLPWMGAHLMDQYPGERHTIFPMSFFYPLLQIFPFPFLPSPERFLSRKGEISVSPNCSVAGALLICCFFAKPFPHHSRPSSLAWMSAAYSAQD